MQGSIIRSVGAVALASSALFFVASPAPADQVDSPLVSTAKPAPWESVKSRAVSYADLNLLSEFGRERMDRRVHRAAQMVCDLDGRIEPLKERQAGRTCYFGAVARANHDIAILVAQAQNGDRLAQGAGRNEIRISSR